MMMINSYLFGPGGGASTPDAIMGTDLLGWYKRGTGIYDSIVGGSLVTTDAQEIGRWEDQSGNGYHMTRDTAINVSHIRWRPAVTYLGVGALQFADGAFDVPSALGSALNSAGQGQIWVVWENGGTAASWDFSSSGAENLYVWSDNHVYEGWGSNTRRDIGIPSPSVGTAFRRYAVGAATNNYLVTYEGASFFSTGTHTVTFKTSGVKFGRGSNGNPFEGYVSEVVIAKAKANSTQLTQMDTYLTT